MEPSIDGARTMTTRLRNWVFGILIVAGMAFAPAAFARGHVSWGVGFNFPGVSIGYSGGHGGWGHGYNGWNASIGYGGWGHAYRGYGYGYGGYGYGWAGNYGYPAYYSPRYYSGYYMPAYYSYPAWYGARYYDDYGYRSHRVVHRRHIRDPYRGDYGHRASYYDRSGYYRR